MKQMFLRFPKSSKEKTFRKQPNDDDVGPSQLKTKKSYLLGSNGHDLSYILYYVGSEGGRC